MAIIRHEINLLTSTVTAGSSNERARLQTAVFSGTCTYYFEIVGSVSSGTCTVSLTDGTTTQTSVNLTGALNSIFRSASFTPSAGDLTLFINLSGGTSPSVKAARIIILQNTGSSPLTASQSQFEIGATNNSNTNTASQPISGAKYWSYIASNYAGNSISFTASIVYSRSGSAQNCTITLQEDDGAFGTWTDKLTIVSAGSAQAVTLVQAAANFTPVDGRHYRLAAFSSSSMVGYSVHCGKIIVTQTGTSGTPISKLVEHYLLTNGLSSTLGATGFLTDANVSSEWTGCTNTYYHECDAAAASSPSAVNADAKLINTSGPVDIANSALADIINSKRSSAITL